MIGITSVGVYIPRYRLASKEIAAMWRTKAAGGEKAVAGYDEDSVTMAVAAVRDCLKNHNAKPDGLFFSTTTAPYREKQNAAIVATVAGLGRKSITSDFTNSLRAGTIALKSALDAVKSGAAKEVAVAASDCRTGAPRGRFEQLLGDGAAALCIGTDGVIAEIEGSYSIFNEFTDLWRTEDERFVRSAEGRFIDDEGYLPTMREAISGLMETYSLERRDFSKIVFSATDGKQHAGLAKELGFESSQVQDPLFSQIGHTGTAGGLIMLIAALEQTMPGERILLANYGDGADALVIRATKAFSRIEPRMKDKLDGKRYIDYGTFLSWRDLLPFEQSNLPERGEPSIAARWRQRQVISSLSGVKCRKCGIPQIHPIGQTIRVCAVCQSKDDFDKYSFSDRTGKLFTYAVDHLQPTKNPPAVNGVVDFDEGGRLICELTDYDLDQIRIGMPVEMTFRKMSHGEGIRNYFWKAKPVD
jgi:3-hydroxy-3-methylglutaryl CoA synthase